MFALLPKLFLAAQAACTPSNNSFFSFPPWWKYIKNFETDALGTCVPKVDLRNNLGELWSIGLAVISMLLYVAGIVAVISIIYSGVIYITSFGNSEKTASAKDRLINSVIGLAIVLSASAAVAFIGNQIGG